MSVTYLNKNKSISTVGMLKKLIHPSWKEKSVLSSSVNVNDLNVFFSLNNPTSNNFLNVAALLSYDQRKIILPDSDFTPQYILMWIDSQNATISLPKELPTINNDGVLNVLERYQAARVNTVIDYLQNNNEITLFHQTATKTLQLTNGFYTAEPHSVLLSNVDLVSPNGNYHIYKNIDINTYDIEVAV